MQLAMVGLGRMGLNMTYRLLKGGHRVVACNRSPQPVRKAVKAGAVGSRSLEEAVSKLKPPRVVWLMVPAGAVTRAFVEKLSGLLQPGDLVIDGGNSHYVDDAENEGKLAAKGIRYMDAGVSGGIWGLKIGYCLMLGGDPKAFKRVESALKTLAPKDGYALVGPVGAGHYSKMVHNGIEYGMMQAYAEGFSLLKAAPYGYDLRRISALWNQGSVVRSWLLELAEEAFKRDPELKGLKGYVEDSGEGRWTVLSAIERGVPTPALATALFQRFYSREKDAFANRMLAALRNEFGGHAVLPSRRPRSAYRAERGGGHAVLPSRRPRSAYRAERGGGHSMNRASR